MLHKGLLYYGDELNPIQQRLAISHDSGTIEMELSKVGDDLDVSFSLHAGEDRIALRPGHVDIIDRDPLWMRVDDRLIAVAEIPVAAETLISYPRLRIPAKDQTEFMERYLLPLAESVPVRGDMVQWQHINAEPERRLYLSERERQLVAELRFGYADYELPYEKHLPPASTRRIPDFDHPRPHRPPPRCRAGRLAGAERLRPGRQSACPSCTRQPGPVAVNKALGAGWGSGA